MNTALHYDIFSAICRDRKTASNFSAKDLMKGVLAIAFISPFICQNSQ
jgi:hypothetical protein